MWPFKRKLADTQHELTDADRDESTTQRLQGAIRRERIRYLRARLQQLKDVHDEALLETEVEQLEEELHGRDDEDDESALTPADMLDAARDSPDALLVQLLGKVLNHQGGNTGQAQAPQQGMVPSERIHISDEQLREYKKRVPTAYLKKLKKMGDEELLATGRAYAPDVFARADDDTIQRAIRILRER